MGRKRHNRKSGGAGANQPHRDVQDLSGHVALGNTWDEMEHGSEDEYFESRQPQVDQESSEPEDYEEDAEEVMGFKHNVDSDDDEEEVEEEEEEDTWGHKRSAYYDGDDVDEDEDAKLEEEEAMRLQKKRTEAMEEADFVDFSIGSLGKNFAQSQNEEEDNQLIAQLNEQLEMVDFAEDQEEITKVQPTADSEDPWQQLEETSPEVIELMAQLKDKEEFLSKSMQPVINRIRGLNKKPTFINQNPLLRHFTLKYELFLCYIANVAYYLSLKAQQVPNSTEHPVLETLVQLNTLVDALEQSEDPSIDLCDLVTEEVERLENEKQLNAQPKVKAKKPKKAKKAKSPPKAARPDDDYGSDLDLDLDDYMLDNIRLSPEPKAPKKSGEPSLASLRKKLNKGKNTNNAQSSSDFNDPKFLDELDAEDKKIKKRSLKHHASHINQLINKRARIPKYSGDVDLPYRDPNNRRISASASAGMDDDYNDNIDLFNKKAKEEKPQRVPVNKEPSVFDNPDQIEEGQKRLASYQILKNKGLTPRRKKEQRNPRVKNRKKFEKASKKLGSITRLVKKPTGSYGGELTGIKTHLSRSTKF